MSTNSAAGLTWRCWTLLAVIGAAEGVQRPPSPGLIALTRNEIRHLLT